jgi:hypothetical protein
LLTYCPDGRDRADDHGRGWQQPAAATVRVSLTPIAAQADQVVPLDAGATGSGTDAVTTRTSSASASAVTVGPVASAPTGAVSGAVTDSLTSQAIAGATVTLTQSATTTTATTNASGQYTFASVPAGTNSAVSASHPNYTPSAASSATFTLAAGGSSTQNLQLQPKPGTITGAVTDQTTGSPLSGATLQLKDGTDAVVAVTTSNANGQYSFPRVAEGSYTVAVSAPGYVSATGRAVVSPNGSTTANQALAADLVSEEAALPRFGDEDAGDGES